MLEGRNEVVSGPVGFETNLLGSSRSFDHTPARVQAKLSLSAQFVVL